MKNYLFILLVSFGILQSSHADEVKIANFKTFNRFLEVGFEINPELGRAWVKTKLSNGNIRDDKEIRTQVKGLKFDHHIGAITLEHRGQLVECALVNAKGRKRYVIYNTGCSLEVRPGHVSIDDGFYVRKMPVEEVVLVIR